MVNKFQSHPWHGVRLGDNAPDEVLAFIEISPFDTIKYEIDKPSGILKIDRPQKYSNVVPALYGFLPQTYCAEAVKNLGNEAGYSAERGDGDPLDILVLSSHNIVHGNILLDAIPIGGIGLIDKSEVDDKVICVLKGDALYGKYKDLSELPTEFIDKFKHYFLTYKNLPNQAPTCVIGSIYDSGHAKKVILASMEDYRTNFGI